MHKTSSELYIRKQHGVTFSNHPYSSYDNPKLVKTVIRGLETVQKDVDFLRRCAVDRTAQGLLIVYFRGSSAKLLIFSSVITLYFDEVKDCFTIDDDDIRTVLDQAVKLSSASLCVDEFLLDITISVMPMTLSRKFELLWMKPTDVDVAVSTFQFMPPYNKAYFLHGINKEKQVCFLS